MESHSACSGPRVGSTHASPLVHLGIKKYRRRHSRRRRPSLGLDLVNGFKCAFEIDKSEDDSVGSKNTSLAGGTPPPIPLALKNYEVNKRFFRELLKTKPQFVAEALSTESDENLSNLRPLIGGFSDEEKNALREILGPRIKKLAQIADDTSDQRSYEWVSRFVDRVSGLDLVGESPVIAKLNTDERRMIFALKDRDFKELANNPNLRSPKAWRVLAELMSPKIMAKVLETLDPSEWNNVFGSAQMKSDESLEAVASIMSAVKELRIRNAGAVDEDSKQLLEVKMIPAVVAAQSKLPLEIELDHWKDFYLSQPQLKNIIQARYWTLDRLEFVPDAAFKTWVSQFDPKAAGLLMYWCDRCGLPQLKERIETMIPAGIKRTIASSQASKLQQMQLTTEQLLTWSNEMRAHLDTLRREWAAGKFTLTEKDEAGPLSEAA